MPLFLLRLVSETGRSAVATIMGLVAKEEVVGVFGVLYGVSEMHWH